MLAKLLRRYFMNRRANVAVTFALAMIPLIFLIGMGSDYTSATYREDQLDAIADSAALAAVTPAMMAQSDSASITAATNTFNAQAASISGVQYNGSSGVTVTVSDSITNRTVTVAFTAKSTNAFPSVLGSSTIALGGSSQAVGAVAPNINFYLLLDDSPSMAIPATSTGISSMVSNTQYECDSAPAGGSTCGCAFACHETNPQNETHCNSSTCGLSGTGNPSGEDNYTLAKTGLGLTLRIDNLRTAVENLTTTAKTTETDYKATYEMAIYTFDANFNNIAPLTSSLSTVDSDAANIQLLEVCSNNNLTCSNSNDDEDTNWDNAMSSINTAMPKPGNGTNATGDTPQEVLFIITDGMVDENAGSEPSIAQQYGAYNGSRQQSTVNPLNSSGSEVDTDWCTKIKNRNIRIAVLYTAYLPLASGNGTGNGWYNSYVAPLIPPDAAQDNIGAQLETCASPGLYYEVTTDGDISEALANLFQKAVQTAYLAK
jgi:Flp pilus assembly protein TadG